MTILILSMADASGETITRSLKDSSAKDQIGGDETEAVVLAVFEFSRNSICSEVQLLT
jgi:hypothetical protein